MKPQASKEIVVAALITDEEGRVLIVKPEHKEGWIFPGGYVEVGEAPSEACKREIAAELGVTLERAGKLLSVDYRGNEEEYIMLIFDGGVFTLEMIAAIKLPPQLVEFRFVSEEEAATLLRANSARRLRPTLAAKSGTCLAYLEHQKPL